MSTDESSGFETIIVEAGGLAFTVDVAGPHDGPLVLLLHGFPQTRHTWRAELQALAAAGYRAMAPDQRGYSPGARPATVDDYRVEHLVADVLALADATGPTGRAEPPADGGAPEGSGGQRFHLVGHDWGGQIAWMTAAHHPDRVRSLSVISRPHPRAFVRAMTDDPAQADRSSHHRSFLRPEATDELVAGGGRRVRRLLGRAGVPPADAEAYLAVLGDRAAMDAAVNWYRAAGGSGLRADDVPSVPMPTLYVWGDEDQSVGRPAAEGTGEFVDGPYRFVEVPGVGHFVTDEAPEVFPPLLLEHLAQA
jgi:pimeloyl-ACP methyl ester carboxylesterase